MWSLRQEEKWSPKPLYTLLGGARSTHEKRGVKALACGEAEVMVAMANTLRVYDFSPPALDEETQAATSAGAAAPATAMAT